MAGTKISALTAGIVPVAGDVFPSVQSAATVKVTASQMRQYVGAGLSNAVGQAGTFAADTYLSGSAITIPTAGGWRVGTQYFCLFDMVKTAAGVATPIITVRMGTLGTTGDASIQALTFSAGSAAIDTGMFEVWVFFRSIGAGTAAGVTSLTRCSHQQAATGLTTQGAGGIAIVPGGASGGFDSTSQTIIGVSFNGGASFSGTNTLVQAFALNI